MAGSTRAKQVVGGVQLAAQHGIRQTMVGEWKRQATEGLAGVFSTKSAATETAKAAEADGLGFGLPLVGVGHQRDVGPDRLPHRPHPRRIGQGIGQVIGKAEPHLHRAEALGEEILGLLGGLAEARLAGVPHASRESARGPSRRGVFVAGAALLSFKFNGIGADAVRLTKKGNRKTPHSFDL